MRSLRRSGRGGEAGAPDAGVQRSRRRFARRQWRRRWLAWRYLVVALVVVLLAGFGIWAAYFSSWLSVKGVDITGVSGGTTLTTGQVRRVAGVPTGGPLLQADLDSVRRRVAALAAVKSVDVSREWPSKVRIAIVERTPVAVIEIGSELHALDASGVVFSSYQNPPKGLPKVFTPTGTSAAALKQAAEVVTALPPAVASRVDHVEVQSIDEISLKLASGQTVRWGSASDSDTKGEVLAALLKARPDVKTYDVSVPGQPVTSG